MAKQTKPKLPPRMIRGDFDSKIEYEEYLAIESDDFNPTAANKKQIKEAAQIATNTIERITGKRSPIGLRLPTRDIQRVKSMALQKGIPYQTLIGSIIHQYLDGSLIEK